MVIARKLGVRAPAVLDVNSIEFERLMRVEQLRVDDSGEVF